MRKLLPIALTLAVAPFAAAADFFWGGDTTGAPTFNRPSGLSSLSGVGTAVKYQVQPFYVTVSGSYAFEANFATGTSWDGYILAYTGSFNPATPLANLINGDDDYTGALPLLGGTSASAGDAARIATGQSTNFAPGGLNLVANTQYYAVVAGFGNTDAGQYRAAIGGGQGDVIGGVVPEPASMAALGAGLLAFARRRRSK